MKEMNKEHFPGLKAKHNTAKNELLRYKPCSLAKPGFANFPNNNDFLKQKSLRFAIVGKVISSNIRKL